MAAARSRGRDETNSPPEQAAEYVIEVVQEIGAVFPDNRGEHPALRVAFMTISDHFANTATGEGSHLEYRVRHPADGHQIKITVDDPPYETGTGD